MPRTVPGAARAPVEGVPVRTRPRGALVSVATPTRPPVATPIAHPDPEVLDAVRFGADGLVPAIVQEEGTGRILMMAWMNDESLRQTLETGRTWFWSRSRQELSLIHI